MASAARADPVGFGNVGPLKKSGVDFDPTVGGWVIGSATDPVAITADPDHSPWVKVLGVPVANGAVPFGTSYVLREYLLVGQPDLPGLPWADWHEFLAEGQWDWTDGTIATGNQKLPGLRVQLGAPGQAPGKQVDEIDFFFDAIGAGTQITIEKHLRCREANGCDFEKISVIEYPTVPEPAVLPLLAVGLLGLVRQRRRARRT